jgi:hypothetical protein
VDAATGLADEYDALVDGATRVRIPVRRNEHRVAAPYSVPGRGTDLKPFGPLTCGMNARETVLDYYEALRRGEPLYPYFLDRPDVVKFGVTERLVGFEAIREGLRRQTATTEDWTVESSSLCVVDRDAHARFTDEVRLAWTDHEDERRRDFGTRWSGVLEPDDGEWRFAGMHVSTPRRAH